MEILTGLAIVASFVGGYLLRNIDVAQIKAENAQLRSFLYQSKGYAIAKTQTGVEAKVEAKEPSVNMKMPQMWDSAQMKPPDLFEARRRALKEDEAKNA